MSMFDPWMMGQNFGGILGGIAPNSYSQKDIDALIKGYGPQLGNLPAADAPQIPADPSGSTPIGAAPQNPYGNPNALMPSFSSTISTEGQPQQQQAGGSWIRPGSFFDKLFGPPQMANAAPAPQMPQSSGAEPSAVWGGPAPQMANVPMPPPRPPGLGQQPTPQQPGPPLSILPPNGNAAPQDASLPPNAQLTQGQMPQQQSGPSFNPLKSIGGFFNALDPSNRPTLQETGVDPFTGQKTFAWVNPQNQTMTPATMGGQPSGTGNAPGGMGAFAEAVRAGVGGRELMKLAPPEVKNRLQAMLDGREAPPTQAGLRNPQVQALLNAAHSIDPTFDETKWGVRFTQRKNYEAGGKQFQEAQALNTVSGHLVNLMKSADALDNTSIPIVNGVMNWLRQNTGDPRIDKLNTDIHAVTSELSKAYKAGHVSDADVRAWNTNINSAKSPEQFKAVIGELNDLLRSKRETLDEGYRSAMGATPMPAAYSSQSERSKGNFDSVSDWSLGTKKPAASGWTVKKL